MASNAQKFDCKHCVWGRHCDESRQWPESQGPAPYPMWEVPGVIRSHTCLKPMVHEQEWKMISLYRHYKNGFLLRQGGLHDQPQVFLDAMATIETQIEKNNREEAERAQKKQRMSGARRR